MLPYVQNEHQIFLQLLWTFRRIPLRMTYLYYRRQLSSYSFTFPLYIQENLAIHIRRPLLRKFQMKLYNFWCPFYTIMFPVQRKIFTFSVTVQADKTKTLYHYVAHDMKKLGSIKITFPQRGHSYIKCERYMGNLNLKNKIGKPSNWHELLRVSRTKNGDGILCRISYPKYGSELVFTFK